MAEQEFLSRRQIRERERERANGLNTPQSTEGNVEATRTEAVPLVPSPPGAPAASSPAPLQGYSRPADQSAVRDGASLRRSRTRDVPADDAWAPSAPASAPVDANRGFGANVALSQPLLPTPDATVPRETPVHTAQVPISPAPTSTPGGVSADSEEPHFASRKEARHWKETHPSSAAVPDSRFSTGLLNVVRTDEQEPQAQQGQQAPQGQQASRGQQGYQDRSASREPAEPVSPPSGLYLGGGSLAAERAAAARIPTAPEQPSAGSGFFALLADVDNDLPTPSAPAAPTLPAPFSSAAQVASAQQASPETQRRRGGRSRDEDTPERGLPSTAFFPASGSGSGARVQIPGVAPQTPRVAPTASAPASGPSNRSVVWETTPSAPRVDDKHPYGASGVLILPSASSNVDVTGPLDSTGDVMLTGSIALPSQVGSTGVIPTGFEESDEIGDKGYAIGKTNRPVTVSSVVAEATTERVLPRTRSSRRLTITLSIVAGVLVLAAVGMIALYFLTGTR